MGMEGLCHTGGGEWCPRPFCRRLGVTEDEWWTACACMARGLAMLTC